MERHRLRCSLLLLVLIAFSFSPSPSFAQKAQTPQAPSKPAKKKIIPLATGLFKTEFTIRIEHNDKVYYGMPIGQDAEKLALLRWDGRISILPRQNTVELKSRGFAPYTPEELKKRLQKQYGSRYLVQSSKHFTVVYPRTNQKDWAAKYEAVYRKFKSYLARHKIDIAEPNFPLIVVVLGSRREFERSLADQIIFKRNVFGFYSRITNRVTTYVSSDPRIAKRVERLATVTVVHEAIHQMAFNCGVHNRLCAVPRWMSEGFAMLFESKGFRDYKKGQPISKRVNRQRLAILKKMFLSGRVKNSLETMLRNDRLFETDADLSYSLAWGLSFYLSEKEPDKYLKFVLRDGNQNKFSNYTPDQRVELFLDTFGIEFDKLERRLEKFIMAL